MGDAAIGEPGDGFGGAVWVTSAGTGAGGGGIIEPGGGAPEKDGLSMELVRLGWRQGDESSDF